MPCSGVNEVLHRYCEITPNVQLGGPTSIAPIIRLVSLTSQFNSSQRSHQHCERRTLLPHPGYYSRRTSYSRHVRPQLMVVWLFIVNGVMPTHRLSMRSQKPLIILYLSLLWYASSIAIALICPTWESETDLGRRWKSLMTNCRKGSSITSKYVASVTFGSKLLQFVDFVKEMSSSRDEKLKDINFSIAALMVSEKYAFQIWHT